MPGPELVTSSSAFVPTDLQTDGLKRLAEQLSQEVSQPSRLAFARSFCFVAVHAFRLSTRSKPNTGLKRRTSIAKLTDQHFETARKIGNDAADLPFGTAAYSLSTLYTLLLPKTIRSKFGIYFTPPSLVERLLDLAEQGGVDWRTANVIDPACGGGAFVGPVIERIVESYGAKRHASEKLLGHLAAHVRGVEIDPFSGWMAQIFAQLTLERLLGLRRSKFPQFVTRADALTGLNDDYGKLDLVIGNPPYGRVTLSAKARLEYSRSLYGHANLYGLFTDLAVRLAKSGGLIAYVTPTSFLGGQYFSRLRELLRTEATPLGIDFISDRAGVFEDVLQETALTITRKGRTNDLVRVSLNTPAKSNLNCLIEDLGAYSLPHSQIPWILPRSHRLARILSLLEDMHFTLGRYGYAVTTGPLVWNRHKSQLFDIPGANRFPLIWAEAVNGSGRFAFTSNRRNHKPFFETISGQEFMLTKTECILVQRTTAKEQERRLVAAILPKAFLANHGAVVIENHLNVIRRFSEADNLTLLGEREDISLRGLLGFLNSQLADDLLRCISGSVAVSAFELNALPLPSPIVMQGVDRLVAENADQLAIDDFLTRSVGGS